MILAALQCIGYSVPIHRQKHIGKCLWYFPHPMAETAVKLQPNPKDVQLPILTFGLVAYARGFKIRQR